jgi:hypothetical protein
VFLEKGVDGPFGEDFAEVVIVGVFGGAPHGFVDQLARLTRKHRHGTGMHEPAHSSVVGTGE